MVRTGPGKDVLSSSTGSYLKDRTQCPSHLYHIHGLWAIFIYIFVLLFFELLFYTCLMATLKCIFLFCHPQQYLRLLYLIAYILIPLLQRCMLLYASHIICTVDIYYFYLIADHVKTIILTALIELRPCHFYPLPLSYHIWVLGTCLSLCWWQLCSGLQVTLIVWNSFSLECMPDCLKLYTWWFASYDNFVWKISFRYFSITIYF